MKKIFTFFLALGASVGMIWATEGALSGAFTINADGDQIVFAQGNLQYQASTSTWQFAANQYDMMGSDNRNIADDYAGWIDLFGWGTGNNPTNSSTDYNDYSTFVDWGANAISNGGNEVDLWRTLTKEEWVFLFYTRTNAASLFGLGSVNDINGTIILPDNWSTPQGVSFTASTSKGLANQGSYYRNSNGDNFSHNTYTAEQWSVMEQSGAVFLPAAGYRIGSDVYDVGAYGDYWSSKPYDTTGASGLDFYSICLFPQSNDLRYGGQSVRLVQAYAAPDSETPTAIDNSTVEAKATKRIVNGQVIIEKNGKWYNALGTEVR